MVERRIHIAVSAGLDIRRVQDQELRFPQTAMTTGNHGSKSTAGRSNDHYPSQLTSINGANAQEVRSKDSWYEPNTILAPVCSHSFPVAQHKTTTHFFVPSLSMVVG